VNTLDKTKLFEAINETGSGCGRVAHFLGDRRHCEVVLTRKVCKKEKLRERDVSTV
jgi:hypothetical protein